MTRGEGLVVGSYRGWKVQIVVLVLVGGTLVAKSVGFGVWRMGGCFCGPPTWKIWRQSGVHCTVRYPFSLSVWVCLSKLYVHTSNVQHTLTNTLLYTKTHA